MEVCGWPFQVVEGGDGLSYAPCQEDGRVAVLDGLELVEEIELADTFHQACEEGLCTGHSALVGAAWTRRGLLLGDPRECRVLDLEGGQWSLEGQGERGLVQHMQVLEQGEEIHVYEPREGALHGLEGGSSQAMEASLAWPLAAGQQLWVGEQGLEGQRLEAPVLAASPEFLVLLGEEELICLEAGSMSELARLPLQELRVPLDRAGGRIAPLLGHIDGETLWLASVFRGALERRSLPDLEGVGSEDLVLGAWAEQAGVR